MSSLSSLDIFIFRSGERQRFQGETLEVSRAAHVNTRGQQTLLEQGNNLLHPPYDSILAIHSGYPRTKETIEYFFGGAEIHLDAISYKEDHRTGLDAILEAKKLLGTDQYHQYSPRLQEGNISGYILSWATTHYFPSKIDGIPSRMEGLCGAAMALAILENVNEALLEYAGNPIPARRILMIASHMPLVDLAAQALLGFIYKETGSLPEVHLAEQDGLPFLKKGEFIQSHIDYAGCLSVTEQFPWKIHNTLISRSANDISTIVDTLKLHTTNTERFSGDISEQQRSA